MTFSVRTSARTAAVLIAAAGALAAVEPALADWTDNGRPIWQTTPQPVPQAAPQAAQRVFIERFLLRHGDDFVPGQEVLFRLRGAAGAQAWFEIPGVLRPTPMTETRPGLYEATYVIRRRDNPDAFLRATATLQAQGQRVTAQVGTDETHGRARPWAQRDAAAPEIFDMTPANGARVSERGWTRITARVEDRGTGVQSANLLVDGRDVSPRVRFDGGNLRYAEDLQPGRHTAELTARDRAGNVSRQAWSFFVMPEPGRGWGRDRDEDDRGYYDHGDDRGYYDRDYTR